MSINNVSRTCILYTKIILHFHIAVQFDSRQKIMKFTILTCTLMAALFTWPNNLAKLTAHYYVTLAKFNTKLPALWNTYIH